MPKYTNPLDPPFHHSEESRERMARSSPNGRFTEDEVREIRAMAHNGQRGMQSALARRYGCNSTTIHLIIHRRTYRWVR